jgi:ubiquinone/menaquinone biosynthesis C-methylase UbiE
MTPSQLAAEHWRRDRIGDAILTSLAAAGKNLDALTIDDLTASDQFHGGGKPATVRLAHAASPSPGTQVLDVGGGFGGPARVLAAEHGCDVTTIDLTETYVHAAMMLTARLELTARVRHGVADALAMPFADATFDMVWTQNSGMNIADKERLYAEVARVLRPGGTLALQEPMAGPMQPVVYPVMWARDASTSFLRTPDEMRAVIERAGFRIRTWDDVTDESPGPSGGAAVPAHSIQRLVMGDALDTIIAAGQRNRAERRIVSIQAVCERR